MSDLMNLTTLGRVVGRARATIQTWCRHGMPHVVRTRPGGGRMYCSTVEACRHWMDDVERRPAVRHDDHRSKGERTRLDELHRAAVYGEWPREVCDVDSEERLDRVMRYTRRRRTA